MRAAASRSEGLERLWKRYQPAWRRLFPQHLRRELELRRRFTLSPVDLSRVADEVPPGKVPDCTTCRDRCCQGYENVVSLRLRDLALLLDKDRADLVTRAKPRFPEAMLEARPSLRAWTETSLWRTLPVLKQLGPARVCAAYDRGRCRLHPHWPTSCARFPYAMNGSDRMVWGARCQNPESRADPERARGLAAAAAASWNRRIEDAVLLTHARPELERLGFGPFLDDPRNPTWEEPSRLPLMQL
ncbi:MAG: hypothetical protein AAFU79_02210 [Myxococcota bacterium]